MSSDFSLSFIKVRSSLGVTTIVARTPMLNWVESRSTIKSLRRTPGNRTTPLALLLPSSPPCGKLSEQDPLAPTNPYPSRFLFPLVKLRPLPFPSLGYTARLSFSSGITSNTTTTKISADSLVANSRLSPEITSSRLLDSSTVSTKNYKTRTRRTLTAVDQLYATFPNTTSPSSRCSTLA